jgi:hypothetical protein
MRILPTLPVARLVDLINLLPLELAAEVRATSSMIRMVRMATLTVLVDLRKLATFQDPGEKTRTIKTTIALLLLLVPRTGILVDLRNLMCLAREM